MTRSSSSRKKRNTINSKMESGAENFYPFKPTRKSGEHYTADAVIIWCFDAGFRNVLESFIKAMGWRGDRVDVITEPGGVKTLVSPIEEAHRASLVWRIQSSLKLHHPKNVVLMLHGDCGAYGGLNAFGDDAAKEKENHEKDLRVAKEYIEKRLPAGTKVKMWFSAFDGLHRIE